MPESSTSSKDTGQCCIDCGAPVESTIGGIPICASCLEVRGSCCAEFEKFDLTEDEDSRGYSSPACYAHEFQGQSEIQHDPANHCFHTDSGARLEYQLNNDNELNITHTFVPESLRGQGMASKLVSAAVDYGRTKKLHLNATCDYAQAYLKRHGMGS